MPMPKPNDGTLVTYRKETRLEIRSQDCFIFGAIKLIKNKLLLILANYFFIPCGPFPNLLRSSDTSQVQLPMSHPAARSFCPSLLQLLKDDSGG
jgi:hypothetical protein